MRSTTDFSLAERVALLPEDERRKLFAEYTDEEMEALEYDWSYWRRPSQHPPAGDWVGWLIVTGRGWGKNRTATEFLIDQVRKGNTSRSALIARTAGDIRDTCVEGESGVLTVAPKEIRPVWEPSKRRLTWPNGAITITYSADEPDLLRGPQHDLILADELAAWKHKSAWDNAMLGLRIGAHPRWVGTTTPKMTALMKELLKEATPRAKYDADPSAFKHAVVLSGGSTYDNIANLAPVFIQKIVKGMEGTRLASQELYGRTLEDSKDALWNRVLLERQRRTHMPGMKQIVVAVDPQAEQKENEETATGIMVGGLGEDDHGYLLEDNTLNGQPHEWASAAVAAYHRHKANRIIAEVNNGGDMVLAAIRSVDATVNIKKISASRGKHTRAEPIAVLYEQGMIHHVGYYVELEDEQCLWVPGEDSPHRLDAAVWCFSDLMIDLKALKYGRDFGFV